MANLTTQEKKAFIEKIAPLHIKYAKKYGFKLVSAGIAQACLESGYGTSYKAGYHNYHGLKYRENRVNCNKGYFYDGGSEQNADGTYTPLPNTTTWYTFENMEKAVEGYYQFINIPAYAKVKAATDPLVYLQEIKKVGYASSLNYVENVYNVIKNWNLTSYDEEFQNKNTEIKKSSLIDCEILSPHHSGKRTHSVDRITPHCVVGQLTAEEIGKIFQGNRQASCNYAIGKEGRVCLVVEEENRSWCSSSKENDQRAITIECASDKTTPYAFNDAVYSKLQFLCKDICERYGKKKLIWIEDKNKALAYEPKEDEMLLTVHRWFANKSCPGDWMYSRMSQLANQVTKMLAKGVRIVPIEIPDEKIEQSETFSPYIVKITAGALNIRKGPGTSYPIAGIIRDKGKYTIVEEQNGFGRLKSGIGWISLKYTQKV